MRNRQETLNEPAPEQKTAETDSLESSAVENGQEQEIVEKAVKSGKLSSLKKLVGSYLIPGILEGGTKFKDIVEGTVDKAAEIVKKPAKLASKLLTGFIPLGHVAALAEKAVNLGIDLGAGVGKALTKASFHAFTFGGFCWLDAMRQHLAVREATSEIRGAKTKKEVAAVSYLEHLKDPEIQEDLKQYYELRKDLDNLRRNPEKNKEKITETAQRIAQFEIAYKDNVDLTTFKSVLEKGQEFLAKNDRLVKEMAEGTAEKLIADAEGYFKNKLGRFAGKVKGEWLEAANQSEGREQLKQKITERLYRVMLDELSDKKVASEISKVNSDLRSSFGVYGRYLKSALYSVMGLAMHNLHFPKYHHGQSDLMGEARRLAVHSTLNQEAAANNIYSNNLDYLPSPDMSDLPEVPDLNMSQEAIDKAIMAKQAAEDAAWVPLTEEEIAKIEVPPMSEYSQYALESSGGAEALEKVNAEYFAKHPELAASSGSALVEAQKAVAGQVGNLQEQVSARVNEIGVVKDIKLAGKIARGTKSVMTGALSGNPIYLGARLGFQIVKYLAF